MRIRGHPVHVMLIHFPVALWPAHAGLHLLSSQLPAGVAGSAGFWLLAVGTALGWVAACCGVSDLLALERAGERERESTALTHAMVNGTVLVGFTGLLALEFPRYPQIAHGWVFLAVEGGLLAALMVGNFLGGEVVWRPRAGEKPVDESRPG